MNFLSDPVARYMESLLPARDPVLEDMEAQGLARNIPIVGPLVGRLLLQQALAIGARRVFELGSAIGYSTLWFARAVGERGQVHYTDSDPANAREAQGWWQRAGVSERIVVHVGDAIESLAATPGIFDIIFIDIDKDGYPAALEAAIPRLRRGGLLIADNVLWSSRVVEPPNQASAATRGIQEFNVRLYAHPELLPVIVPLRDGVTIALKLA